MSLTRTVIALSYEIHTKPSNLFTIRNGNAAIIADTYIETMNSVHIQLFKKFRRMKTCSDEYRVYVIIFINTILQCRITMSAPISNPITVK